MVDYCVGGSLAVDDPTYVERSADRDLYQALVNAEFCYVLTARQMGKSSLRLRTRHRLEADGRGRCAAIDMTRIGSSQLTPEQWYQGLAFDLHRKFALQKVVQLSAWWHEQGALSPVQKLSQFIETILLTQYPDEALYIFLDEIDSVRGLNFSVDDFFGLIRFCQNARAEDPRYCHLTWALFGVATPRDLIIDPQQAPFNIGQAIRLTGFSLTEAQPLAHGLGGIAEQPTELLRAILAWTSGQPFLTQKLCALMRHHHGEQVIAAGTEADIVAAIANACLINHWESQDDPEHLRTIRDRLLASSHDTNRLLG
ncbi:MAG: AAA-like domain-containing protein, partial [Cyanobacteria bacterium P01_H01_bin.58]